MRLSSYSLFGGSVAAARAKCCAASPYRNRVSAISPRLAAVSRGIERKTVESATLLRLDLCKQGIGFDQFAFVDCLLCLKFEGGRFRIIAGLRRGGRLEGFELFCNFDQLGGQAFSGISASPTMSKAARTWRSFKLRFPWRRAIVSF